MQRTESQTAQGTVCPICSRPMAVKTSPFTRFCAACDYWNADLPVDIEDAAHPEGENGIDDRQYIASLDSLRQRNFAQILDTLEAAAGGRTLDILDVGCASGVFMTLAIERGHHATGVEPNRPLYLSAVARGLPVIGDYFPPAQGFGKKFDVIIFNDVFEHIPDLNTILQSCEANLVAGGLLVINLPNSDGLIFRLSRVMAFFGMTGLWNRLWQTMFRTPHLHYFNAPSLKRLLLKHSFAPVIEKKEIATVQISGFWARLALDKTATGMLKNVVLYLGMLVLYPVISIAQKDTFYAVYRHRNQTDPVPAANSAGGA